MPYPAKHVRNTTLVWMRDMGKSWRQIGRELGIHHVTAKRLYDRWQGRTGGIPCGR